MSYEVLALKWRPKQFSDVVGQDHVTGTLANALSSDRVAHAYIFVGPRGTGKTSIARILAKSLNCEKGITTQPCNKCTSCVEITIGNNLDVQEIDGASNRGIDEIRSLRETVKYVSSGRYRIYIIDEVHMLTTEAFNALLKTLEEPPSHVKFLFATTEPHKVPLTIISRCQRFDLRRIPVKLLVERLGVIAKDEGVDADENVLLALARAAEGSLRDAESGLDQLISFKGKSIHEKDVLSVFGLVSRHAMDELMFALLKGDIASVIRLVEEFDSQGKDIQRLLVELLERFLLLMVFMQGGREAAETELIGTSVEAMQKQAEATNVDRLIRLVEILVETMDRLRYALSKKTLLEAALIRCASATSMVSLDSVISQINELKKELGNINPSARASESHSVPQSQDRDSMFRPTDNAVPDHSGERGGDEDDITLLRKQWHSIVEYVGREAVLAKNALLDAAPLSVNGNVVTIGFDKEFSDRVEQIKNVRNRNVLHKALSRALGREISTEFQLVEGNANKNPPVPDIVSGSDKDEKKNENAKNENGNPSGMKKWVSDKTVGKTLDLFDGMIVDVRE